MRLFIALYPPPAAVDHLRSAVDDLWVGRALAAGVNTRVTATHAWHVTLAFLGEVPDDRVGRAEAALAASVHAWSAPPPPAAAIGPADMAAVGPAGPELAVAGGGTFGRGRFTVLWAGLAGDVAPVTRLAAEIGRQLRRARLPRDGKPFRPHLTIARVGDRLPAADVAADVATLAGYAGPSWPAGPAYLVQSQLGPRPVYTRLTAVPLA